MEADTTTSSESNHHHKNHEAASDTESDQLDWDPENFDDDGHHLVDENGSTLVPVPREGPLDVPEASSLTAWAQGYGEVRKIARFGHRTWLLQTRAQPVQESRAKNHVREETTETRPKHPHTSRDKAKAETKRKITAQNVSLEPS